MNHVSFGVSKCGCANGTEYQIAELEKQVVVEKLVGSSDPFQCSGIDR